MKKPDLLILVAIWMFMSAFGATIGISAIALFAFPYTWDVGGIFGLSIAVFTLAAYIGISIAGGIGLLQSKDWGRLMGIVHSAISLFGFPIGTIIGVLSLVYLFKPDVVTYFKGTQS